MMVKNNGNCKPPSYSSDLRRAVGLVTLTPKTLALKYRISPGTSCGYSGQETDPPFQYDSSVTAAHVVCDLRGVFAIMHQQ